MSGRRGWGRAGVWIVALALAGTAAAQTYKSLPADYTFPQHKKSPGPVVFKHATHVSEKAPDCTGCHPGLFKITVRGQTADGSEVKHSTMKKGRACGACHIENGKAFGLDECERCHTEPAE